MKKYKPTSPGVRAKQNIYGGSKFNRYNFIFYTKKKNMSGRSNKGNLLVYSKGKKKSNYFLSIDKCRNWSLRMGIIIYKNFYQNMYMLGLLKYSNGALSLIKLAHGILIGSLIKSDVIINIEDNYMLLGSRIYLGFLERNSLIFDVATHMSGLPVLARAPGTYCQVLNVTNEFGYVSIKIPSGCIRYISGKFLVTLGRNSNIYYKYIIYGKAGIKFSIGKKSIVRGVAMNPVDHPHGGRTKTNKPEVSPWGWVTKYSH